MEDQQCLRSLNGTAEIEAAEEPPSSSLDHADAEDIDPLASLLPFRPVPGGDTAPALRVVRPPRVSARTRAFRRAYYPGIKDKDWNDWRWQVKNRVRTLEEFERFLVLSPEERRAFEQGGPKLPVGVTPYYLSLVSRTDPTQAIRRSVIPTDLEFIRSPGDADDPLHEEDQSPVPGLVHRYPDRALLLSTEFCSTYCRYCTRSRVVGHGRALPSETRLEAAFDYIRRTESIRDVLVSGGDPLTLSDTWLEWVLSRLRAIPHVEIIRLGTKVATVLPQRITPAFARMVRKYHPVWMSLHFTHPDECTEEAAAACATLADAGIPLGSQTVLLKGVNDDVGVLKSLMHHLMKMRVRPYYLYQCDPITGSAHFRTPVERGLEMIQGLRGHTTGYAVPTYVIDAPGGGGKIPLMPNSVVSHEGSDLTLRNFECRTFHYPDGSPG